MIQLTDAISTLFFWMAQKIDDLGSFYWLGWRQGEFLV